MKEPMEGKGQVVERENFVEDVVVIECMEVQKEVGTSMKMDDCGE